MSETENKHVLVVEDEEDIRELIRYNLEKEGFSVRSVANGERALESIEDQLPRLVLLDIMLPGIDGLEICKELRKDTSTKKIPIIMLSAKGEERDIVKGLELGADDYLAKPFSPKVLLARIGSVLRRSERELSNEEVIEFSDIKIDPGRFEVFVDGTLIKLTLTEFRLLHFLARNPGRVFTRYQIVDAVKGEDYIVTDRAVDVQIVGLRKKLASHDSIIETVRGVGYRFKM